MCDTIFAFGQRGGHFLQCPSKRDHSRLPKRLQILLSSKQVGEVHHVTLGYQSSFLITYRDKQGVDHIASENLPTELHDFLYAKNEKNIYLRSIPNLRLTLGPYNASFFAGDGSSYLWMNLPPLLLEKLQSRIQNGAFTDQPRIVALGADNDFLLITEKDAAIWDLGNYRMLSQMLDYARRQDRGIEEVVNVTLHPYRYGGFVAQSRNGTLMYDNMPQWTMDGIEGMKDAIVRDSRETVVKRRQRDSQRRAHEFASRAREWEDRMDTFERTANANRWKLSLSLNIGPAGIGFRKVFG
ncbi:uncharacterized protein EI97DRAFT_378790 [Westerdykella ornata]|uniref:Uncharacterized protein n=1 Tax=Westerdykella ornata TaxID=318751 RepID=A0A6A6JH71_WESOR|nr:uncharacterized protein EI97DRAFT_378790 [Westerdykella ornata]KAF2275752.1 hypothetical protein EI97DRAFT_378790 [Westerdykella ornata]